MNPITKGQARDAAQHAQRCVGLIRDGLPIQGTKTAPPVMEQDDWFRDAGEAMVRFRKYHPVPGRYQTAGPQDFARYWRMMADGMVAIVDHYVWHDVDGENKLPHSDARSGEAIPPIDPALLDRVDRAASWLIDLAPQTDDERANLGVELWNSGKTWREVAEVLEPEERIDQLLIDATKQFVKRYAKKHGCDLRKGRSGRPAS